MFASVRVIGGLERCGERGSNRAAEEWLYLLLSHKFYSQGPQGLYVASAVLDTLLMDHF